MPAKRLRVVKHLTLAEIEQRYEESVYIIEKSRWEAIKRLSDPGENFSCQDVAELMRYSPDWVRKTVRRYNADPHNGLTDKRGDIGNTPILNEKQLRKLRRKLKSAPPGHGRWTSRKVAQWIAKETGQPVSAVTGWNYFSRVGDELQLPRRKHRRRTPNN